MTSLRQRPTEIKQLIFIYQIWSFPGGSVVKNPLANATDAEDVGLMSGLRRSPGEGTGNPLQYSCLEKSHGQKSLEGYSP